VDVFTEMKSARILTSFCYGALLSAFCTEKRSSPPLRPRTVHCSKLILGIIFSRRITEKVSNRQMYYIPTLRNFCITGRKCRKSVNCIFSAYVALPVDMHLERCEHIQVIITWSLMNHCSFAAERSSVCIIQDVKEL